MHNPRERIAIIERVNPKILESATAVLGGNSVQPLHELRHQILATNPHLNPLSYFLAYNLSNFPQGVAFSYGIDYGLRFVAGDRITPLQRQLITVGLMGLANVLSETVLPTGTHDINDIWMGFVGIGVYWATTAFAQRRKVKRSA